MRSRASLLGHLFVPLASSSLTTVLAFTPLFLADGPIGEFVGPIGLSVALALAGSFFVSLAVVASVGDRFLQEGPPARPGQKAVGAPHLLIGVVVLASVLRSPGAAAGDISPKCAKWSSAPHAMS